MITAGNSSLMTITLEYLKQVEAWKQEVLCHPVSKQNAEDH